MDRVTFPRQVEVDTVTGLPPRKILDHDIPILLRSMGAASLPLTAIMIDIDHFKKFNDKYGHDTGDVVLRHVASIIRTAVRFRGEAYRYGGEEITVLMLNTTALEGLATAKRICRLVDNSSVKSKVKGKMQSLSVQVSLGVASTEDVSGSELIVSADQALYTAKSTGRNMAELFAPSVAKVESTTLIDVHFPGRSSVIGGNYILLKEWFSHDNPLDIVVLKYKDPNTDSEEMVYNESIRPRGLVKAEIRGKVSSIERMGDRTHFKLEVKNELIDLMFKYIQDSRNESDYSS